MFRAFHVCLDYSENIEKVSLQGKADLSVPCMNGSPGCITAMPLQGEVKKSTNSARREGFPQVRRFIRLRSHWQLAESS